MDIDDQLEMLQRELMTVQQEKTNPLSQRTVAEIMVKLYHEGFSFYPTTDGNEYVVPNQLDKQIEALVKERGKINLSIIPQILNIGGETIESRLSIVLQKSISRHGNNLFSNKYFDHLLLSLRHRLQSDGRVDLDQVAIDNELNIKVIQKLVGDNLELLQAQTVGTQLITRQYTLLKKSKILGFLTALNNPISLETFIKVTGLEGHNLQDLIRELISDNLLRGRYQNGYYVPEVFTANQKNIITQFFENNGFIEGSMLQKKFLVSRPEQWLTKNLAPGSFVIIENFYFKPQKLQTLASQTNQLLKSYGFVELSHVLPVELGEKNLHMFLERYCELTEYFICDGYCYSNQWLEKVTAEFKQKIIFSIFFKKNDPKKDGKKKGGKKQKDDQLTQDELKETLFNCGFAEYSVAQTLAPELLPLLNQKIVELKKKIEKELGQNKGFINANFLKFRSGKTILRTQESFSRMINMIQKQQKKQKWSDFQFGPTQSDGIGQYSMIYYDNSTPKGWPSFETLKWVCFSAKDLLLAGEGISCKKSHFSGFLQILDFHNNRSAKKIPHPQVNRINEQSMSPFIYKFHITEKDRRYVIVDDKLPIIEQRSFFSLNRYSFAQKAYAKLRYCYKAISNVGIQQIIFETTGISSQKISNQNEKDRQMSLKALNEFLEGDCLILLLGEGQSDKRLRIDGEETSLFANRLYYLFKDGDKLQVYPPTEQALEIKMIPDLFKNIYHLQIK